MELLITAFEPFGGEAANASLEILRALPDALGAVRLRKQVLPVVFGAAGEAVCAAMDGIAPDAVVCLGQAGGRDAVTPERVAVNLMDARIPDNAGARPVDVPVDPEGPAAYFSTLPVRPMTEAMRAVGVNARISDTAGTFVCNSVMYAVLRHTDLRRLSVPCGFIHIPYLDGMVPPGESAPSLSKEEVLRGLTAALETLIRWLS